jgi:hypothetical protein
VFDLEIEDRIRRLLNINLYGYELYDYLDKHNIKILNDRPLTIRVEYD